MEESLLREISEKYLLPFFSGARIERGTVKSGPRDSTVSFITPQVIAFKVSRKDSYRLQLIRHKRRSSPRDKSRCGFC